MNCSKQYGHMNIEKKNIQLSTESITQVSILPVPSFGESHAYVHITTDQRYPYIKINVAINGWAMAQSDGSIICHITHTRIKNTNAHSNSFEQTHKFCARMM